MQSCYHPPAGFGTDFLRLVHPEIRVPSFPLLLKTWPVPGQFGIKDVVQNGGGPTPHSAS